MVRKLFGVLAVALVLCFGAVLADEFLGSITKVDGDAKGGKITVSIFNKDTMEKSEKVFTYTAKTEISKNTAKRGDPPAITKMTATELKEAVENAKGGRGAFGKITTKGSTMEVEKIEIGGGRGRGKGGN